MKHTNRALALILALAFCLGMFSVARATATPTDLDPEAKLRISPVDKNGLTVSAPEGDYGQLISIRIPLKCQESIF
jgi:hypothetical protein